MRTHSWGWWAWGCGSRYRIGPHCQGPCIRRRSRRAGGRRAWRCKARQRCRRPWERGRQRRWASYGQGTLPLSWISVESPFLNLCHPQENGIPETLHFNLNPTHGLYQIYINKYLKNIYENRNQIMMNFFNHFLEKQIGSKPIKFLSEKVRVWEKGTELESKVKV